MVGLLLWPSGLRVYLQRKYRPWRHHSRPENFPLLINVFYDNGTSTYVSRLGTKQAYILITFIKFPLFLSKLLECWLIPQIREQMSGPDLHVFSLKFLAQKRNSFSLFRDQKKFFFKKVLCNFAVQTHECFQKKKYFF